MNFGGIIAGALSGGAQAVGQIADDNLKEQAAMRAEQRSLALNMEKFEQEADYKLRLDRQAQERYMADAERVTARAGANMRGQDAASLDMLNNQVGGEAPEMSREEIATLLEENLQYRQVYEQAGYMAPRKQSGIIGEEVRAARELGADPALRKDLTQAQKDTISAEDKASRERREDQRYNLQVAREERQSDQGERRLELLAQQIANKGSKDSPDTQEKLNTTINTHRQLITADSERLKTLETMDPKNPEIAGLKDGIARSRAIIAKAQKLQDTNLSGGDAAPSPAPRPGSSSPVSGGKPSWQSPQAYSDQVQIILNEWRKESDPEVKAALTRELKRLGVDPTSQSNDNRGSGPGAIPQINSREELNALPKGSRYIAPDGTTRIKS